MKIIKKAYKFRIYPTLEQITFFSKNFGCVRKVHNLMLDDRKKGYEEYKSTGIKTEYPHIIDGIPIIVDGSMILTNVVGAINRTYPTINEPRERRMCLLEVLLLTYA